MRIAIVEGLAAYKERIFPIVQSIASGGGTAYLVGGCVRDMVLNLPLKDLDIEVHGLALAHLQGILQRFGIVEEVGKKFGVLLLLGLPVDWSLPREDSSGRKPTVTLQPNLDLTQALRRRDLTMNAMAINLNDIVAYDKKEIALTEIIDPFNGLRDLEARQLCAVDDNFFTQDPLRLLRVMQFIGRFGMQPSDALSALCKKMVLYDTYDNRPLASERMHAEVAKLLLQSKSPSAGLQWIIDIGKSGELFPFLINQGEVTNALCLVDRMAESGQGLETFERLTLMFAALCWPHWSKNNSESVRSMLAMCTGSLDLVAAVAAVLIALQQLEHIGDDVSGVVVCKKIAAALKNHTELSVVVLLAAAVYEPSCKDFDQSILFLLIKKAGVLHGAEEPLVLGRDLLEYIEPGPKLGKMVAQAYDIQLEEGIKDKAELIRRIFMGEKR